MWRKSLVIVVTTWFLSLCVTKQVQAHSYGANWDESDWRLNAGPFGCSLVHKVPGFGQVLLSRKAGADEKLELQRQGKDGFPPGAIQIRAIPPSWRSDLSSTNLGMFNREDARSPLHFNPNQTTQLLEQLERGLQLVFTGAQGSDGQVFRVMVSPRNFSTPYSGYRQCLTQLIPYSFEQLARITLYYQKDATELSSSSKSQLDKVARYSQADKQVLGVIVDAHSDSRSSAQQSQEASRVQADLVTRYLVEKGMSAGMITSRWHGDKYPAASNNDEQGRAKNRRVTLRLENAETRLAMEKRIAKHKQTSAESVSSDTNTDSSLGLTLKELERMVESQDLSSGKQPRMREPKTTQSRIPETRTP